jgi:trans-aconitate 2-methyltransferase
MSDWSAKQYLKFADERTRAARDLLAQVPLSDPQLVFDLGCGPGNSTALLAEAYPYAEIIGVDNSPDMLATARATLPDRQFIEGDLSIWRTDRRADLIFANAVFQWVPGHVGVLREFVEDLKEGGVLAVQMPNNLDEPSHLLMRETAGEGPWKTKLADASAARDMLPPARAYYDALKPVAKRVDIWETAYYHPLDGAPAILEWLKGTGLRPFIDPLEAKEKANFLARYEEKIAIAYPRAADGKSLLRFPRLFIVAQR